LGGPIASEPENAQPTVIERSNGDLYALMRTWHDDPAKRFLWQAESKDYGRTWSRPSYSAIPSVNSAIEMVKLRNGHAVLAFNHGRDRERTPLNLALSLDEGRTWPFCRALETGEGSFSYPSLVETKDGNIHVTYSHHRQFIKHVELNEAWIKRGMGEGIN
jgi:predicted neuraminidase